MQKPRIRNRKHTARPARGSNVPKLIDAADATPKKAKTDIASSASVIDWLLSDEAFNLANPEPPAGHGEIDWEPSEHPKPKPSEDAGKQSPSSSVQPILRYPQSDLTPFQNLVSACILSKPLSHRLGLRTIQTLLNPPFGLRTLGDLDEAGYEGRRKVMWEARTQHKEKTAAQLGDLVEGLRELCGDKDTADELDALVGVRDQIKETKSTVEAQESLTDLLTQIKGIGPGVAAIFLRRVQKDWPEVFPFADDRSLQAAVQLGLIKEKQGADELAKTVDGDRKKFVKLLDVLVGLNLEKKIDEAVQKAGA